MRTSPTLKVVHKQIIEKPHHDPAFVDTELHVLDNRSQQEPQDNYDYYPDFGI
ncbi:hypothetical protein G4D82_08205 [Flavobacterium sp. CYK-4]|uniref:hypothetical protein n=1 Tax=Flavobacterium lotistagni TaxID=2709660 RepID=UPI001409905C|nr:hypothetical protein [Flavobacterium lotistagni]NHM07202.1 hypothetical protein [Flavobacterium lotistagni]